MEFLSPTTLAEALAARPSTPTPCRSWAAPTSWSSSTSTGTARPRCST